MDSASKVRYFPALTGFRALAAFLVFFHHFSPVEKSHWAHAIIREGHIGVTLFFVLSGFLIAYRYPWLQERRPFLPFGDRRFWQFCVNRVARIWPVYLVLTVLVLWHRHITDREIWITNLTFLRGFSQRLKFTGVAAGWSLTVEETFYFLAPFLFAVLLDCCSTLTRERRLSERGAMRLSIVAAAVGFLLIGNGLVSVCRAFGWPFFEEHKLMISFTFFGRSFEFLCGYYAAQVLRRNEVDETAYVPRSGVRTGFCLVACALVMYGLSRLQKEGVITMGFHHPCGPLLLNVLMPPFAAGLIYCLATERTWVSRLLSTRLMVELGLASYCFYLLHQHELHRFLKPRLWNNLFCVFVATNVVSWLGYRLFEEPMNRGIRRLYARIVGEPRLEPTILAFPNNSNAEPASSRKVA